MSVASFCPRLILVRFCSSGEGSVNIHFFFLVGLCPRFSDPGWVGHKRRMSGQPNCVSPGPHTLDPEVSDLAPESGNTKGLGTPQGGNRTPPRAHWGYKKYPSLSRVPPAMLLCWTPQGVMGKLPGAPWGYLKVTLRGVHPILFLQSCPRSMVSGHSTFICLDAQFSLIRNQNHARTKKKKNMEFPKKFFIIPLINCKLHFVTFAKNITSQLWCENIEKVMCPSNVEPVIRVQCERPYWP